MPQSKIEFAACRFAGPIAGAGRAIATWSIGAALVAGTVAAPAGAATQGSIGAQSTGTITITATVPQRAQITGLTDVTFTNADPTLTATSSQSDCVWSNTASKGYTITATGSGTGGAFTIANGTATVPYSVKWSASPNQTTGTALVAGTTSAGLVTTATVPGCTVGPASTSSLTVAIQPTDLQTMVASASYTGTLTLLVQPM